MAIVVRRLKLAAPLIFAGLAAALLALVVAQLGEAGEPRESVALAQPPAPRAAPAEESGQSEREYRCRPFEVEVPAADGCARGEGYPACRWQLPDPPEGAPYVVWRNTTPEHRWARPGLVSLVLASAADYARRWPGERLVVGDLDAPGPRHQTHDRGVDVDLYLVDAMMTRNEGRGRYVNNYEHRSRSEVRRLRERVMDLARILAVCAGGEIRIYYNDPEIVRPFREWFEARGLRSSVGPPMRPHNRLHEFHFHLTVADELAPLER